MEKSGFLLFLCAIAVILITVSSKHLQSETSRHKRASSDQRVAELQALIALSRGSGLVGHGHIDPFMAGKRKRAMRRSGLSEGDKDQLLYSLVQMMLSSKGNNAES